MGMFYAPSSGGGGGGTGPAGPAGAGVTAWANVNGAVAPDTDCTIRAGSGFSSVHMNADLSYTFTFSTPQPDANYCITANCSFDYSSGAPAGGEYVVLHGNGDGYGFRAPTNTQFTVGASNDSTGKRVAEWLNVAVFR